jgi:hypothetical protein
MFFKPARYKKALLGRHALNMAIYATAASPDASDLNLYD